MSKRKEQLLKKFEEVYGMEVPKDIRKEFIEIYFSIYLKEEITEERIEKIYNKFDYSII